jgi:hypothetical protein
MSSEEISEAKKLSNLVKISRGRGIFDSSEFVGARKNSLRS